MRFSIRNDLRPRGVQNQSHQRVLPLVRALMSDVFAKIATYLILQPIHLKKECDMTMNSSLTTLFDDVKKGTIGTAKPWYGADVAIVSELPDSESNDFYPGPRFVVTKSSRELSWLFERLREIFLDVDGYGQLKEEIFGRLGNSANRYLAKHSDVGTKQLLSAVMHEAFSISEEIDDGEFETLVVAFGNEILDDLISDAEKGGFLTIEETLSFFKDKGIIT